jgi:translation initiation factor 1 (eIF-1/SUI1)
MPFTIGGEWIPSESEESKKKSGRPVKVFLEKRKQGVVTLVRNLSLPDKEMRTLTSQLKKRLGCGGGCKDGIIQLQGDRVTEVQAYLKDAGHL